MNIYSISDLHLSVDGEKPMDIFGDNWQNHYEKIKRSWNTKVKKRDIVLISGDLTWAMNLLEAAGILREIDRLPGTKIILKGNHDYWWNSLSKINELGFNSIKFLQNNSFHINGFNFAGTRGWLTPEDRNFTEKDMKVYKRELNRLHLSLNSIENDDEIIVMLHYPPFSKSGGKTGFSDILESDHRVQKCIYGHLHNDFSLLEKVDHKEYRISYFLTSSDYLDFELLKIV